MRGMRVGWAGDDRMHLIATAEAARTGRKRAVAGDGMRFWLTPYFGSTRYDTAGREAPSSADAVAFLVEQDAGEVTTAHYHQADEFQVVVAGNGTLGRHVVRPVSLHFAGAYTSYGPIQAGAGGLTYFTLRNGFDPGARYMLREDNRAALRAISGRRHREGVAGPLTADSPTVVLGPEPDGLAAWRHSVGAGQPLRGSSPTDGGGQYWLVVEGRLDLSGGAELGPLSCVFVPPDDARFAARGGSGGAVVLAMQFPRRPH